MAGVVTTHLPKHLEPALGMALAGKLDLAEQICRRLSPSKTVQAEALNAVAQACSGMNHRAASMPLLRRAIKLAPDAPGAHTTLANIYLSENRFEEAIPHLTTLYRLDPLSQSVVLALAQANAILSRNVEAINWYQIARANWDQPIGVLWELSKLLMTENRYEEVAGVLEQVVAIRPDHVASINDLGVALLKSGRTDEAIARFEQAVATDPAQIPARVNLASALKTTGRYLEAAAHLRRVAALTQPSASIHAGIAQALIHEGQFEQAITECRDGFRLDPEHGELHHNYAVALRGLKRHEEAMAHFEIAHAKLPRNYSLLLMMGNAALELGDLPKAESLFAKLVQIAPQVGSHHRSYSNVHKYSAGDPHAQAMEAAVAGAESVDDQIELLFALGKAYGDSGETERSFHCFQCGAGLKRTTLEYDEAKVFARFDLFERYVSMQSERGASSSERPIFVVGMPRSGTSLIEQILASHPDVVGLGERPDWQNALESMDDGLAQIQSGPTTEWLTELGERYLRSTDFDSNSAIRTVDKMPSNSISCGLIHLALPNAKIVHIKRDPVDTCFSCFTQLFSEGHAFTYDLAEIGRYYKRYEAQMAHWRAILPPTAFLEVSYEELVEDLENQARRIVEFVGLDWDDACLAFHQTKSVVLTASAAQVRKPIYKSSVGRTNKYAAHLQPLRDALNMPPRKAV
jgi:tetratricopeptide (TPR) repeat protein